MKRGPRGPYQKRLPDAKDRTEKRCPCCERVLPVEKFHVHASRYDGRQSYCAECMVVLRRTTMRASHLKAKYGLVEGDYEEMLRVQEGRCAVCDCALSFGKGGAGIDHCHKTGVVRGILCRGCNAGIGMFLDVPSSLRKAADYVERGMAMAGAKEAKKLGFVDQIA